MTITGAVLCIHTLAVGVIACVSTGIAWLTDSPSWHSLGPFCALVVVWMMCTLQLVEAHGYRVLVRTMCSNAARLQEGAVVLSFPEYVVRDSSQFGPWSGRKRLPLVGQVLDVDVPEIRVPVEQGLYCLKVNTKVVGVVQSYSVKDLTQNPIPIEARINDVIANALRSAVYDKPLEEALVDIQRLFLKDAEGISALISTPAFKVTQLLLDANEHVAPLDASTSRALDIIIQRKQEVGKRAALEASAETEAQKVKLRKIAQEGERNEYMLQQEAFGKEGAALVEAAKHAKVLYLCAGMGSAPAVSLQGPAP